MKLQIPYGQVDLPGDWYNETTYVYSTFPEATLQTPLHAGGIQQAREDKLTVTVATGVLDAGTSVEELLKQQESILPMQYKNFEVHSRGPWAHSEHGEVPGVELSFTTAEGVTVRQRQLFFVWPAGDRFSCLSLSAREAAFAPHRAILENVFEGFRLPATEAGVQSSE